MSFSVTDAHACVVLFYFVYLSIGAGACGWVVDTVGHGGGSILQGLGCSPTVGLFWALDIHLGLGSHTPVSNVLSFNLPHL